MVQSEVEFESKFGWPFKIWDLPSISEKTVRLGTLWDDFSLLSNIDLVKRADPASEDLGGAQDFSNKLPDDAHTAGPPLDHVLNSKALHNCQRDLPKA